MPRPLSRALAEHVVDWRGASRWPLAWSGVFGRTAPLAVEIGFGNGEFLEAEARRRPDRDHVGIELSWTAATHLFRRLDASGVRNARVLLADAEVALRNLFASGSLAEVFVHHPCPWPKARHHRRRLLNPSGLALLTDRMQPGAHLTVVTDHAEYAAWLVEVLTAQEALVSRHPTPEISEIPGRPTTKYERKARAQGLPIHFFEWEKAREPFRPGNAPATLSEPTDAMPSLTLRGAYDAASLFSGFEPQLFRETHRGVDLVVRPVAAYRRLDEPIWLVEVLTQEDGLRQEFGVLVVERGPDQLLVKLSDLGRPHPTHGVKRAVFAVGRWLRGRHPGLEVVHDNLGADASS